MKVDREVEFPCGLHIKTNLRKGILDIFYKADFEGDGVCPLHGVNCYKDINPIDDKPNYGGSLISIKEPKKDVTVDKPIEEPPKEEVKA